jgi:hypothetical protein
LVGIGTLTPFSPLTFNNNLGEKISLYGNSGNNYGFGITFGTLQIHSDAVGADIAFGYGSGTSFTERMRIMGNGNVGIGISNPQHPLDIDGRMRLSGTNPNDPGIWLNDAGIDRAFIGLQNNNHVGFYGANSGIAWGFTMNTGTGALKINENEGQPGQVLVSNGGSAAAGYTTIGNVINSSFKVINDYSSVSVNSPGVDFLLPQLSHTITLTRKSRLINSAGISMGSNPCVGCAGARAYFKLKVNGSEATNQYYTVYPSAYSNVTICNLMMDLNAGTHNFEFYVQGFDGVAHWVLPKYSSIIILPVD